MSKIRFIILSIIALTAWASPHLDRRAPSLATQKAASLILKNSQDQIIGAENLLKFKYRGKIPNNLKLATTKELAYRVTIAQRLASVRSFAEKIKPELRLQPQFSSSKSYLENLKQQLTIDQKRTLIKMTILEQIKGVHGGKLPIGPIRLSREGLLSWPQDVPFGSFEKLNSDDIDKVISNLDEIMLSKSFLQKSLQFRKDRNLIV